MVEAERIAADGATTASLGSYPLAALADLHGVPFWVSAPLAAVDFGVAGAADSPVEFEGWRLLDAAPRESAGLASRVGARGPLQDVTPPKLIDAIVTDAGVLRAPFVDALRAVVPLRWE